MSKVVDERVVQMDFDNSKFEKNVKSSLSTLDKLKQSLNFSGISSAISGSLGSVDTSVLSNSIEKVTNKFSTLEVVAITAISNITNRVINLGERLVKSLSVDNIASGWQKYAEQTKTVGTLISQGNSQEDVGTQIQRISWFADETSYSFNDMMNNISKFTATGQKLEDSATAMMGIANWAALCGQNAQTASGAMYQLSQAMGAGFMKLQDWRSIQNSSMDTDEFRQHALDAAVAIGTLTKSIADGRYIVTATGKAFEKSGFTTMLSEGWFNKDVMMKVYSEYASGADEIYDIVQKEGITATEAIEKYSDKINAFGLKAFKAAQEARTLKDAIGAVKEAVSTGWSNSFGKIFGSYDESVSLWSDLAVKLCDVFAGGATFRNAVLDIWKTSGGRDSLFSNTENEVGAFWQLINAITSLKDVIKNAWNTIFPLSLQQTEKEQIQDIGNKLVNITKSVRDFLSKLVLTGDAANNVTSIFKGMFSVLKLVIKAIEGIYIAVTPVVYFVNKVLLKTIEFIGKLSEKFTNFVNKLDIFKKLGAFISDELTKFLDSIDLDQVFNALDDAVTTIENSFSELFKIFKDNGGTTNNLLKIFNGLKSILEIVFGIVKALGDAFNEYLLPPLKFIISKIGIFIAQCGGKLIKFLADIGEKITGFSEYAKKNDLFKKQIEKFIAFVKTIPSKLEFLKPFFNKAKVMCLQVWEFLKKTPKYISNFIENFNGGSIKKLFNDIKTNLNKFIGSIQESLKKYSKTDTSGALKVNEKVAKVLAPFKSLFKGIKKLFTGLWSVVKALLPVVGHILEIIGDIFGKIGDFLSKIFTGKNSKTIVIIILITALVGTLIFKIIRFAAAFLNWGKIFKDVIEGFADVLDSIALMTYAKAIMEFAEAIAIISGSLMLVASIDTGKMLLALGAIITIMGGLIAVLLAAKKFTAVTSGSKEIACIADAGKGFKNAIKSWLDAKKDATKMASAGKLFVDIGVSILLIAFSMQKISKICVADLLKAFGIITLILGEMAVLSKIVNSGKNQIKKGSNSLKSFAISILLLTIPMMNLSSLGMTQIAKSLLVMSGLMLVVSGYQILCKKIDSTNGSTKKLIGLAIALNLMVIPFALIGKMNSNQICNGMAFAGEVCLLILTFALYSRNIQNGVKSVATMAGLAGSLIAMALAFKMLGSMSLESSISAVMCFIGIITAVLVLQKNSEKIDIKNILVLSAGIFALSLSFAALGLGLKNFNYVKWDSIGKAAVVLLPLLTVMALFSKYVVGSSVATAAFGASMIIFSVGIYALGKALQSLSKVEWEDLGKGMLIIVGALAIFAGISALLAPVLPVMVALSIVMVAVAVSIKVFSASLNALISCSDKFSVAFSNFLTGIASCSKQIYKALSSVFGSIFKFLRDKMPDIISLIVDGLVNTLDSLVNNSEKIISSLLKLLRNILVGILDNIEEVLDILYAIIKKIVNFGFDKLHEMIPYIIDNMIKLVLVIIDAFGQALEDNAKALHDVLIKFFNHIKNAFCNFFGIHSPSTLFESFGGFMVQGLVKGILGLASLAGDAIKSLCNTIFNSMSQHIGEFFNAGKEALTSLWNGMVSMFGTITSGIASFFSSVGQKLGEFGNNVKATVEGIGQKISDVKDNVVETGKKVVEGIGEGISSAANNVKDAVGKVGNDIKNTFCNFFGIHSPSKVFAEYGKYLDLGLAKGLEDNTNEVTGSIDGVGNDVVSMMSNIISKISDAINGDLDNDITIRPVMDLSDVQNGTNKINGMLSNFDNVSIDGTNSIACKVSRDMTRRPRAINETYDAMNSNDISETGGSDVINNTFNITGSDPEEIANKVSEKLQRQIDRRNIKWAR